MASANGQDDDSEFAFNRKRDAWATIRGYWYQIAVSVHRWIDLDGGEILELESGEDIDRLSAAHLKGVSNERLVEQVKFLTKNITLRSAEAVTAIANHLQHQDLNPSLRIHFLFTTTANVARERGNNPLPRPLMGMDVWREIALCSGSDFRAKPLVHTSDVLKLIQSAAKPQKLSDEGWTRLQSWAAGPVESALQCIRTLEWSTGQSEVRGTRRMTERRLSKLKPELSQEEIQRTYLRLLAAVLETISQPGRKQLTCEFRNRILEGVVSENEQLLARIDASLAEFTARVSALEAEVAHHSALLNSIVPSEHRYEGEIAARSRPPVLEPPPLDNRACERVELLTELLGLADDNTWVHIQGSVGAGKSTLARQLFNCRPGPWIRMGGLDHEQAFDHWMRSCSSIGGSQFTGSREAYEHLASSLPNSLLFIDELPRLPRKSTLAIHLRDFWMACQTIGAHVVATSNFGLPTTLLGPEGGCEFVVPRLRPNDIGRVAANYGAPEGWASNERLAVFAAASNGHPMSVSAACSWLSDHNWPESLDELWSTLDAGVRAKGYGELLEQMADELDEETNGLLHRLTLFTNSFSLEQVRTIATVDPEIARLLYRITLLDGPWLERVGHQVWRVSPLLGRLGDTELSTGVRRGVHRAIALSMEQRSSLEIAEALDTVSHWMRAAEPNRAGRLYLGILAQPIPEFVDSPHVRVVASLWHASRLPSEMKRSFRIAIRGLQIRWCEAAGLPFGDLVNELETELLGATNESGWAILIAAGNSLLAIAEERPAVVFKLLRSLLATSSGLSDFLGPSVGIPEAIRLSTLFWISVAAVKNHALFDDWMSLYSQAVSQGVIEDAPEEWGSTLAMMRLTDQIWMQEADKPESERRWIEVVDRLAGLRDLARSSEHRTLESVAVRGLIIVYAEYLDDWDSAVEAGGSLLERGMDGAAALLVNEQLARQHMYRNEFSTAADYFNVAFRAANGHVEPITWIHGHVHAGYVSLSLGRAEEAVALLEAGAEFAMRSPDATADLRFQALAELALGIFHTSGAKAAFRSFDAAAEELWTGDFAKTVWWDRICLLGHVSGYLTSVAATGLAPGSMDNGEAYSKPEPRFFLSAVRDERVQFARSKDPRWIAGQLAMYAEVVSNYDASSKWLDRALVGTSDTLESGFSGALQRLAIPALIEDGEFREACQISFDVMRHVVSMRLARDQGQHLSMAEDYRKLLDRPDLDGWNQVDYFSACSVAMLMATRIGLTRQEEPERAQSAAQMCSDACIFVASKSSSKQSVWPAMGHEFQRFFDIAGFRLAIQRANEMQDGPRKVVAFMSASMLPGAALTDCVVIHINCLNWATRFGPSARALARLMRPFFVGFWRRRFERQRFRFSAPSELDKYFAESVYDQTAEDFLSRIARALRVSTASKRGREY